MVLLVLALTAPAAAAALAPDSFDPAFGTAGVLRTSLPGAGGGHGADALALDPAGRLLVLGRAGERSVGVLRLDPSGRPDPAFDGDGAAVAAFPGAGGSGFPALAVQAGGALAAGFVTEETLPDASRRFALVRFDGAGRPDPAFGGDGLLTDNLTPGADEIAAAVVDPATQDVVVAGSSDRRLAVARYGPTGSRRWVQRPAIAGIDEAGGAAVALAPDGRVVAAGTVRDGAERRLVLAGFTAGGAPDPAFGAAGLVELDVTAGTELVSAMVRQPDGRLVVIGADGAGRPMALRFDAAGTLDPGFGQGGIARLAVADGVATGVALQADGKLVLSGVAEPAAADSLLARLRPNGSPDPGFGVAGVLRRSLGTTALDRLEDVVVTADGGLVAAGSTPGSTPGMLLARLAGGDASDPALTVGAGARGDLLTFTALVANRGPDPARDVQVRLVLPTNARATAVATAAGPCAGALCSLGTIPAGRSGRVTVLARASGRAALSASAVATSPTWDRDPANNAGSASVRPRAAFRPDRAKPKLRLMLRTRRLGRPRRAIRGLLLAVRSGEAATVALTVRAGAGARARRVARDRISFVRRGTRTVTLRLDRATRRLVARRRVRRLRLVVSARATDRRDNVTTRTLRRTLRR